MSSIERRLQLALGTCLALFALALWAAGTRVLDATATGLVAERLEHDTEALLAALHFDPDGTPRWRRLDPIFERPFSGHYFVVRMGGDRQWRSRSLWDERLEVPVLGVGESASERITGPGGRELMLHAGGFSKAGREFTLAVAEDLGDLALARARLRRASAAFAIAALAVLALVQHLVLRRALQPLARTRTQVQALARGERDHLSEDVPSEVLPLVREINRLLAALVKRLERARHAAADLAHGLKTPLHLLARDLADERPQPAAAADARLQAERIRALIERELRRARLAGTATPHGAFDPRADLADLIATVRRMYRERPLRIDCEVAPQTTAFGDREDLQEMLGNLLDNACKWAAAVVQVRIAGDDPVHITVEDDGPGLTPEQLGRVAERGTRLDETRAGHGLGLAIVRDIVHAYGGGITFDRAPVLGGLRVTVHLPRTPDRA